MMTTEKAREQKRAWAIANRASLRAADKAWRQRNKSKIQARAKAYRDKNKTRIKAAKKAYRDDNKELVRAQKAADYLKHKTQRNQKSMQNYLANREKSMARFRENYAANAQTRRETARQKYASDRERFLSRNKKYRDKIPIELRSARSKAYQDAYRARDPQRFLDRIRRGNHKRKARLLGAFVEPIDAKTLFARDKGVCGICRRHVSPKSRWHIDHIIPLSKGGLHCYANVQVSHARCNWSKNAKIPDGQLGLFQKIANPVATGGRR